MSYAEPNYISDVILFEEETEYSRDKVTIISGQNLAIGTVVGKITASGKYTILAPAAIDGSEVAAGIMTAAVDASAGDAVGVIIAREAIAIDSGLVWPGGITGGEITTATGQLKTATIIVRKGV